MKLLTEQQWHWYYWGKYLGYPQCCIDFFVQNAGKDWWMNKIYPKGFKFKGSGYIPCKSCNKLPEEQIIKRINYRRKASVPFPQDIDFETEEAKMEEMLFKGELK